MDDRSFSGKAALSECNCTQCSRMSVMSSSPRTPGMAIHPRTSKMYRCSSVNGAVGSPSEFVLTSGTSSPSL